ncbi:MAG: gamma-butyrobetaine hydroxylase-like domain-containing protein [Burkholderiaceae bacterium]
MSLPPFRHNNDAPIPDDIEVNQSKKLLTLRYENGRVITLPFELMRVYSPSAEVVGHGPGQETLQTGKRHVSLIGLEPIGNYALQPQFSDGHDSGFFTWSYLQWLGDHQEALWDDYLKRLEAAGASRDPASD